MTGGPKAKKAKTKVAEERNAYANWSLLVDKAVAEASGDVTECDDSASDCGASTVAGFSEADCEKMGMTLWYKEETAEECLKRWLQLLDVAEVMLDICFLKLK